MKTTTPSESVSERGVAALREATDALLAARLSIARMLDELPGQSIQRAAEVERALGLDPPLAWRVFRTATASDAPGALQHLPPTTTMTRVLSEARKRGVPTQTIDEVLRLLTVFDTQVKAIAGDRAAFSALLSGQAKHGATAIEHRVRKAAFKNNAHLWSKQCRSLSFLFVVQPDETGQKTETIAARGWVDLHATRPDTTLVIHSHFLLRSPVTGDLLVSGPAGSLGLVPGFYDNNRLHIRTIDGPNSQQETRIQLGIGRADRMSLFIRQWLEYENRDFDRMASIVSMPAESLIYDLLLPVGWSKPSTARAAAYARSDYPTRAIECRAIDEVPLYGDPEFLPDVENVPPTPDVPRWPDLVKQLLTERGWWGQRFELYRLRVAYPILHSCIVLDVQNSRDRA